MVLQPVNAWSPRNYVHTRAESWNGTAEVMDELKILCCALHGNRRIWRWMLCDSWQYSLSAVKWFMSQRQKPLICLRDVSEQHVLRSNYQTKNMEASNGPKWRSWIDEGWRSNATSVDFTSGELMPHQLVDVLKGTMADVSKPDTGIEAVTGAKMNSLNPYTHKMTMMVTLEFDSELKRISDFERMAKWFVVIPRVRHPRIIQQTSRTAHDFDSRQIRPMSPIVYKQGPQVWH